MRRREGAVCGGERTRHLPDRARRRVFISLFLFHLNRRGRPLFVAHDGGDVCRTAVHGAGTCRSAQRRRCALVSSANDQVRLLLSTSSAPVS